MKALLKRLIERYNRWRYPVREPDASGDPLLDEIRVRAMRRTDISDHLETLYRLALASEPALMVELGVRSGESTFALCRAARRTGAWLVSVDVAPVDVTNDYERWWFVHADDVELAGRFREWTRQQGLPGQVDFLFVDTSHEYEHTRKELAAWMPLMSERGIAVFHDTHMNWLTRRRDGSWCGGWWNRRGVIRALEEWLGTRLNERECFERTINGWQVGHDPFSSGLTWLRREPTARR